MAVRIVYCLAVVISLVQTSTATASTTCVLVSEQSSLYPFGIAEGDEIQTPNAERASIALKLKKRESFPFYATRHKTLTVSRATGEKREQDVTQRLFAFQVHGDGYVVLNGTVPVVRTVGFPHDGASFVAAFWTELDLSKNGRVSARIDRRPNELLRATRAVQRAFSSSRRSGKGFNATWMAVATWDKVVSYNKRNEKVSYMPQGQASI